MAKVRFADKNYFLNKAETVLDCLLRHKVNYPHSCKSGTCQSCLSQTAQDDTSPYWQKGLKPTLVSQGYFLPCIATPDYDISIALPNEGDVSVDAKIIEIFHFNHNVICVRLVVDDIRPWIPGQYLNLINPNGDVRSYSIANQPYQDGYIELHVKLIPKGIMGTWLNTKAEAGTSVSIRGPIGNCFYCNPENEPFPIVLAGTGTGLAPLIAIVLDAIFQNHSGEIYLIHGGVTNSDLYLDKNLTILSGRYDNFHYEKCTLEKNAICQQIPIAQLLLSILAKVINPQLYVCGPEDMTKKLRTTAFLAGVSSNKIYSDAFTISI